VEGVHCSRGTITSHQLGRNAAAINVSGIAAKRGIRQHLLVSLALPPDLEVG
jgi:thiamine monophosphate kinase